MVPSPQNIAVCVAQGRLCAMHVLHWLIVVVLYLQANVDVGQPAETWALDQLAGKLRQYCPLLDPERVNADALVAAGGGDFEELRSYLRAECVTAYRQKVESINGIEAGLMQARDCIDYRCFIPAQVAGIFCIF